MAAIFYLVMAVGAQSRSLYPLDGKRANLFFDHGRQLACLGLLEDPSMPTIQAFVLMSFYMLGACRRNGSCLNLSTAVGASYALGLHSRAANATFGNDERSVRSVIHYTIESN